MIPASALPDCPQCGTTIRQAERIGVSAAVEPCGHFIPAEFFRPSTVETGVQQELVADGGQEPVQNRQWIAELLECVEFVDWDRFVTHDHNGEQVVVAYGWIERETDQYKDFVLARFWTEREVLEFTTSSDRYSEELHRAWFSNESLDDHNPCRRIEDAFEIENAIELGEQTTLCDGGSIEDRRCTTCGKSVDDAPYGRWLFGTCSSCAAEPAPSRWSAGMAPGTAVKWAYTPRWHIDEHPESDHHIVADGGVVREDLSTFGGGVDHGPHVSLMDCMAAVRVAGIEDPPLADPLRSWREFGVEVKERVFRTTLYAVRRACPDAPTAPPAEPPETDYAYDARRTDEPEQSTLTDLGGESA